MKKGLEFLSNRIVVSIILIIIQIIAILIFAYTLFIDLWVFKIIFMMLSLLVVLYIINKEKYNVKEGVPLPIQKVEH